MKVEKELMKKVCVVNYLTTWWAFLEIQLTLMLIKNVGGPSSKLNFTSGD